MTTDAQTKEEFGTDRLDPDDARMFIGDMVRFMRQRVMALHKGATVDRVSIPPGEREAAKKIEVPDEDDPSMQQQFYGDAWKLIYGIYMGMQEMKEGSSQIFAEGGTEWKIDDHEWQEHYDQYGYGPYGRGLEIGKKLAFYEDTDFDFTEDVEQESEESESDFTFTEYDG